MASHKHESGGRLTTHVLDTAHGRPASQMMIELWRITSDEDENGPTLLKTAHTNKDGRTDEPLLQGSEFTTGVYEIVFVIGAYFAQYAEKRADLPFLDRVPVRFGVSQPSTHYHVPLLASPWAYSTYRGS